MSFSTIFPTQFLHPSGRFLTEVLYPYPHTGHAISNASWLIDGRYPYGTVANEEISGVWAHRLDWPNSVQVEVLMTWMDDCAKYHKWSHAFSEEKWVTESGFAWPYNFKPSISGENFAHYYSGLEKSHLRKYSWTNLNIWDYLYDYLAWMYEQVRDDPPTDLNFSETVSFFYAKSGSTAWNEKLQYWRKYSGEHPEVLSGESDFIATQMADFPYGVAFCNGGSLDTILNTNPGSIISGLTTKHSVSGLIEYPKMPRAYYDPLMSHNNKDLKWTQFNFVSGYKIDHSWAGNLFGVSAPTDEFYQDDGEPDFHMEYFPRDFIQFLSGTNYNYYPSYLDPYEELNSRYLVYDLSTEIFDFNLSLQISPNTNGTKTFDGSIITTPNLPIPAHVLAALPNLVIARSYYGMTDGTIRYNELYYPFGSEGGSTAVGIGAPYKLPNIIDDFPKWVETRFGYGIHYIPYINNDKLVAKVGGGLKRQQQFLRKSIGFGIYIGSGTFYNKYGLPTLDEIGLMNITYNSGITLEIIGGLYPYNSGLKLEDLDEGEIIGSGEDLDKIEINLSGIFNLEGYDDKLGLFIGVRPSTMTTDKLEEELSDKDQRWQDYIDSLPKDPFKEEGWAENFIYNPGDLEDKQFQDVQDEDIRLTIDLSETKYNPLFITDINHNSIFKFDFIISPNIYRDWKVRKVRFGIPAMHTKGTILYQFWNELVNITPDSTNLGPFIYFNDLDDFKNKITTDSLYSKNAVDFFFQEFTILGQNGAGDHSFQSTVMYIDTPKFDTFEYKSYIRGGILKHDWVDTDYKQETHHERGLIAKTSGLLYYTGDNRDSHIVLGSHSWNMLSHFIPELDIYPLVSYTYVSGNVLLPPISGDMATEIWASGMMVIPLSRYF